MDRFEEMAVSIYEAMVRAKRLRKSAARSRGHRDIQRKDHFAVNVDSAFCRKGFQRKRLGKRIGEACKLLAVLDHKRIAEVDWMERMSKHITDIIDQH